MKKVMGFSRKRNSAGEMIKTTCLQCIKKGLNPTSFFTNRNVNGKCNSGFSLCEIVELVWYWMVRLCNVIRCTERSQLTITLRSNFWKKRKNGGVVFQVQIDESLFQDKWKYNCGRILASDRIPISPSPNE